MAPLHLEERQLCPAVCRLSRSREDQSPEIEIAHTSSISRGRHFHCSTGPARGSACRPWVPLPSGTLRHRGREPSSACRRVRQGSRTYAGVARTDRVLGEAQRVPSVGPTVPVGLFVTAGENLPARAEESDREVGPTPELSAPTDAQRVPSSRGSHFPVGLFVTASKNQPARAVRGSHFPL